MLTYLLPLFILTSTPLVLAGPGVGAKIHNYTLEGDCPQGTTVVLPKWVPSRRGNNGHSIQIVYPPTMRVTNSSGSNKCTAKINLILPMFAGQAAFNGVYYNVKSFNTPRPDSTFTISSSLTMEGKTTAGPELKNPGPGQTFVNGGLNLGNKQWGFCHTVCIFLFPQLLFLNYTYIERRATLHGNLILGIQCICGSSPGRRGVLVFVPKMQ
jgi:hypothetical protein